MDYWNTFVTTVSATGVASAAFVFLAKIFSKHLLSMDLERFKADLKATNEKELERLRADLRIAAFQQETTFAKLHEKRAEVIAELYSRLDAVHKAVESLLSPVMSSLPNHEKREAAAAEAGKQLIDYYTTHQIYFEEHLCAHLRKFIQLIANARFSHLMYPVGSKESMESWQKRCEAWDTLQKQAPVAREEIECSFRQLLGLSAATTLLSKTE